MPALRKHFFGTLRQMLTLSQDGLLLDKLPIGDPHNSRARILRHGLTISAFSSLEKYLEARTQNLVTELSLSGISFSQLTDDLKKFLSIDAVIGLANRISFQEKIDQQSYTDNQLIMLSSYSSTPPLYTSLGFSPKGSNVYENDIQSVLSAFCVPKPWSFLSSQASLIGASRIDLKTDYLNLARARHRSAHNPNNNIATIDLITHIKNSILIGICFDVTCFLVAKSLPSLQKFTDLSSKMAKAAATFRFIDEEPGGTWAERVLGKNRVLKRYSNEAAAIAGAKARANAEFIVLRDVAQTPIGIE